ncbi:MAG: flagellar biosynthetic protein FliO [Nitrosospira sp.]
MNTGNVHVFLAALLNKAAIVTGTSRRVDAARHPKSRATKRYLPITLLLSCSALSANAAPEGGASVSGGGMLQVMLGLGLVLAVIAGSAWLLRRFGGVSRGPASAIKIIGGSSVGQRERVVLVEVADTWLVIGVAPGHVTALHSMPKGEVAPAMTAGTTDRAGDARFSIWLRQVMEKRNEK